MKYSIRIPSQKECYLIHYSKFSNIGTPLKKGTENISQFNPMKMLVLDSMQEALIFCFHVLIKYEEMIPCCTE